jgi:hypothetical protein
MRDPSLPLQGAVTTALKASSALHAILGDRVYDAVPLPATYPYINVGEGHVIGDDSEECADASEIYIQVHAWSRDTLGYTQVKRIADGICIALNAKPSLSGFVVTACQWTQTQYLTDPDGQTRHAMVEFRYLISPTS